MLFACIPHPKVLENFEGVNGIELRLDLFPSWNLAQVQALLEKNSSSIITLRGKSHGGSFRASESQRESQILKLLSLKPTFFDLEWDMREDFLKQVTEQHSQTKFILSYHNFEKTPQDLETIYQSMHRVPVFGYKIATMTNSTNDALRMLLLSKKYSNLSTICMGEKGEFARVLGRVVGNQIDYGCITRDKRVAPGQLCIQEMCEIYRYLFLNRETALYGLIGDPVEMSQGHIYHNGVFAKKKINAVYVKMRLCPEELSEFFPLAKELGFRGLSVTMPLKEAVQPYINHADRNVQSCKATNTLCFAKNEIKGTNTDGRGALDAIEKKGSVEGKKIVILGAGGAARAIAYEAIKRKALAWIVNRTKKKAQALAKELGCFFAETPPNYDILIGCTPSTISVSENWVKPGTIVMDITYVPKKTPLLKAAQKKGCTVIYGEEMFLNQAKLQTKFWFL